MLDNEAEHGIQNWVSPSEIARLLLMRRVPKLLPGYEPSGYRVLGVIIPDLDEVMQTEVSKLPSPASPILPMCLRPALLAGVAIVQHAGPEMLRMLSGHMMGENKAVSASFYTPSSLKCCQAWRFPLNIGGHLDGQRHS